VDGLVEPLLFMPLLLSLKNRDTKADVAQLVEQSIRNSYLVSAHKGFNSLGRIAQAYLA
jgi:hypothetical protein